MILESPEALWTPACGLWGAPCCHPLPRVQDAASSPDPVSGGDEGSQQRWKEKICQILREIQAPLSSLLLRSRIFWGNILGFSGGWIQVLLEMMWDFGRMHMDPLGGFVGSFWGMGCHTLGDILGSFGKLPSGSSVGPGAIPLNPSEELEWQNAHPTGGREAEKTCPFLFPFSSHH